MDVNKKKTVSTLTATMVVTRR